MSGNVMYACLGKIGLATVWQVEDVGYACLASVLRVLGPGLADSLCHLPASLQMSSSEGEDLKVEVEMVMMSSPAGDWPAKLQTFSSADE